MQLVFTVLDSAIGEWVTIDTGLGGSDAIVDDVNAVEPVFVVPFSSVESAIDCLRIVQEQIKREAH